VNLNGKPNGGVKVCRGVENRSPHRRQARLIFRGRGGGGGRRYHPPSRSPRAAPIRSPSRDRCGGP